MILASTLHASPALLAHLIAPAVRSLLIACFAALTLGALRIKGVAARLAVWTAVLYAALAMPLLGVALPSISLEVPAAAARFVSQRFGPVNAPGANEKSPRMQTLDAVPAAILPDTLLAQRNSRIRVERKRVPLYAAPAVSNPSSASDSDPVTVSSSVIVPPSNVAEKHRPIPWTTILSAVYFFVAIIFVARLFVGVIFSRRLVRSARPILDGDAIRLLANRAREASLAVPPQLAESGSISVPVTLGILRPVILFPVEWREWDSAALHAVIAHELSHVIRRDALTQRLSLLHRAIFWFSPLGWWLHRCLADAAEEASDEAALVSGADRARYAETLLGFFATLQETPRRIYWEGVSMAKAGQAEKRVDRILAWKGDVSMRLNKFLAVSLLLVGVPVVLFAAAARPSVADTSVATATDAQDHEVSSAPVVAPVPPVMPANPAPAAPPATPVTIPNVTARAAAAPAVAPMPPLPAPQAMPAPAPKPVPPATPKLPTQDQVTLDGSKNNEQIEQLKREIKRQITDNKPRLKQEMSADISKAIEMELKDISVIPKIQIELGDHAQTIRLTKMDGGFSDRYVVVSGDSPISMSGDSQDVEHATALRSKISGDFIWFQRDEKSYLIRDQATVNRAKEIFKPEQELGQKQQALGKQQQALGDQQRDIGKKMQTIQVQLPDMTADMQKLEAEMKQLNAGGTQQQLGDLQRQLGELQRKVGQVESQAGEQQRQISEPMRALGQQQRALGDQQRALGDQQREASHQARDQMKQLLDDAIAHGTAQPE